MRKHSPVFTAVLRRKALRSRDGTLRCRGTAVLEADDLALEFEARIDRFNEEIGFPDGLAGLPADADPGSLARAIARVIEPQMQAMRRQFIHGARPHRAARLPEPADAPAPLSEAEIDEIASGIADEILGTACALKRGLAEDEAADAFEETAPDAGFAPPAGSDGFVHELNAAEEDK